MQPYTRVLNHLLAQNPWARERLIPYAGKSFQLNIAPMAWHFTIAPAGDVLSIPDVPADATLRISPSNFLRFALTRPRDPGLIAFEGEQALAEVLRSVLSELSWEAEEDLSRLVGDVLAHRLTGAARSVTLWGQQAFEQIAQSGAEYLSEERAVLVPQRELARFTHDIHALDLALNQLEQRIAQLPRS